MQSFRGKTGNLVNCREKERKEKEQYLTAFNKKICARLQKIIAELKKLEANKRE